MVLDDTPLTLTETADQVAFEAACVNGTGLDVDYDTDGPSTFTMTTSED